MRSGQPRNGGKRKKKKKETDKLSRRKQREEDLNRQTGGSLTPRKLFFPDAGVVVVVTHLHIEGVLSKRALAGELEVVAEEEGSGQKTERMTEVKKTKQQTVTEGARRIFLDTCLSCQVLNDFQTLT